MAIENHGDSTVLWQKSDDEYGVGEPALMLNEYSDTLIIQQEDSYININYASIPELIRVLKKIKAKKLNAAGA